MLFAYFSWHYGRALRQVLRICGNFLAFAAHLFSLKELSRSLFSPWKQIAFTKRGTGPFSSEWFGVLITNVMSRILGAIVRSAFMFVGALFWLWVAFGCVLFAFLWIVSPFLPPFLFLYSLSFF